MERKRWIWQAMFLGLVFFLAAFFVKPIGVSTQFSLVGGIIHSVFDPSVISVDKSRPSGYKSTNAYYDKSAGALAKSIKNPWNYDFVFVLAIPLGAYIAHKIATRNRKRINLDYSSINLSYREELRDIPGMWRRYSRSFLGGFIILFGARWADGCTSGHMMSGMLQSSVSGYVFALAVFATAIPTAIYIRRQAERDGE